MKLDTIETIKRALFAVLGAVILAMGAYAAGRTVVNILMYDNYPASQSITQTAGTLYTRTALMGYFDDESACEALVGDYPGMTSEAKEKKAQQKETCRKGFHNSVRQAKFSDAAHSVLLLAIGAGFLYASRRQLEDKRNG